MEKLLAFGKKHKAWFTVAVFVIGVFVLLTLSFGDSTYTLN